MLLPKKWKQCLLGDDAARPKQKPVVAILFWFAVAIDETKPDRCHLIYGAVVVVAFGWCCAFSSFNIKQNPILSFPLPLSLVSIDKKHVKGKKVSY